LYLIEGHLEAVVHSMTPALSMTASHFEGVILHASLMPEVQVLKCLGGLPSPKAAEGKILLLESRMVAYLLLASIERYLNFNLLFNHRGTFVLTISLSDSLI
jgi:hypothetical protein